MSCYNFMLQVFDMNKFKEEASWELCKPQLSRSRLEHLCLFLISLDPTVSYDFKSPGWLLVINFSAIDLLGEAEGTEARKGHWEKTKH